VDHVYRRITEKMIGEKRGLFRKFKGDLVTGPADPSLIEKVILVGGSTRIPYISDLIKKYLPKAKIYSGIDVDKAVARGACEICVNRNADSGVKSLSLIPAVPLTVGIKVNTESFCPLLEMGSSLPCDKSQVFTTFVDNQTAMSIEVAMGERPVFAKNIKVGQLLMELSGRQPKGVPQVEITLGMTEAFAITVNVKELSSGKTINHVFDRTVSMPSSEKISEMLKSAKENAESDAEYKKKSELFGLFETTLDMFSKQLSISKVSEDDKLYAETIVQGNREWVDENKANESVTSAVVEVKLQALQKEVEDFSKKFTAEKAEPEAEAKPELEKKEEGRDAL